MTDLHQNAAIARLLGLAGSSVRVDCNQRCFWYCSVASLTDGANRLVEDRLESLLREG